MTEKEKLCAIKVALTDELYDQLSDLEHANTIEMGQVTDIIKDIEEALYYCHKINCMEIECEEHSATPTT